MGIIQRITRHKMAPLALAIIGGTMVGFGTQNIMPKAQTATQASAFGDAAVVETATKTTPRPSDVMLAEPGRAMKDVFAEKLQSRQMMQESAYSQAMQDAARLESFQNAAMLMKAEGADPEAWDALLFALENELEAPVTATTVVDVVAEPIEREPIAPARNVIIDAPAAVIDMAPRG